ncbi:MAG: succinoglycan biosynthesis protein ExoL [Acetobacteraceae bacterium]|jgi:succinoglycan biosynthesis protein ExoL|nr:succinoglycan biosynthesis protein ExoL [Acetobacteraceae bacterium]
MNLVYFVHDLNDPAVHRRMRMFHAGGAKVSLLGFYRGEPPDDVDGTVPLTLGRTADTRLWQRAASVLREALLASRWRSLFAGADAILARQLETLVLAAFARRLFAPSTPLIFECLDIHPLMGASGRGGDVLRTVERRVLARCQKLVVSSPYFISGHFARVHKRLPDVTVVENKALDFEFDGVVLPERRTPGPPWRIGWFGVIRCARSLRMLADLAIACPGVVEIIIRGRVATSVLPQFDSVVAATPGLSFGGPYDRACDLPRLYGDVHFAWAVDFYEAGSNSDWLLPNRLYEAGCFGAIPIACHEVATGAWLAERGVGVLLEGDPTQSVGKFIRELDDAGFRALRAGLAALPKTAFLYTREDCRDLVATLAQSGQEPLF